MDAARCLYTSINMITKSYYLRDRHKIVPELEFNSLGLAKQVAEAMARTYPIGNYSVMYIVRSDNHRAIMSFEANNSILFKPEQENVPCWPEDAS